jgi:hypothetical protein
MNEAPKIERIARRAVDRLLAGIEANASEELPAGVRAERDGDRIALMGRRVRLRALTEARIIALFRSGRR